MADSSFFKNNGTSTQLQGSASASAAAALASEQAALASQTAASTSETNSAASAAASATSAAQSLSSANSSAASQSNAATSEANALASSTNAQEWAVKTNGIVDSTDYASKAWAIGGTGVTGGDGASKEWSTHLGSTVDGSEYSAKHYSQVAATEAADAAADAVATAADRVQTGLDVVAAAGSATAASNSQIAAASSAAAAAATLDTFDDRYLGSYASDPTVDNDGNALVTGALYFNTTANEMRVYDGGNWIAASSAGGASLTNYHFTATAAQTTFSGSDDNSRTLSYTVANLIVTRNGVVLEDGTDYTATSGTSIVLASSASAGDEINIVAFKSFTTADMVSATNGGAFQGNVDFAAGIDVTGNVTVTGTVDGRDVAADGTKLDGIEASADVTDDTNVRAAGAVMTTGVSTLADSAYFKGAPTHGFRFNDNGDANNNFIIRENGDTYTRGNAGIGIASPDTSPSTKLHIREDDAVDYKSRAVVQATDQRLVAGSHWQFGVAAYSYLQATNDAETVPNSLLLNPDGGDVGIGTSVTGDAKLVVYGADAATIYKNANTGTGSGDGFFVGLEKGSGTNAYIFQRENTNMIFGTNNTERLNILPDGNVLISGAGIPALSGAAGRYFDTYNLGTDATSFAIHRLITNNVAGTGTTSADIYKRKNGQFTIANNETDTAAYMNFQVGTQERMRIDGATGNVGIATTLIPADASLTVHDDIKLNAPTPSKQRIYSLYAGTAPYSLGSSGGAAVVFDRLSDGSDELAFETHYAGNSHTEKMRISREGRVTMPYQPVFSGNRSGLGTANGLNSNVNFTPVVNQGNHWNTSTHTFTCPVAGKYWVSVFNLNYTAINGGASNIQINKNNGTVFTAYQDSPSNVNYSNSSASGVLSCAANDTITFFSPSGVVYADQYCGATVYLIG